MSRVKHRGGVMSMHQIDPRDLTAAELAALRRIAGYRLRRIAGGWGAPGAPTVSLRTAQRLVQKSLARKTAARIELTGIGINTLAVAEQRGGRRA